MRGRQKLFNIRLGATVLRSLLTQKKVLEIYNHKTLRDWMLTAQVGTSHGIAVPDTTELTLYRLQ